MARPIGLEFSAAVQASVEDSAAEQSDPYAGYASMPPRVGLRRWRRGTGAAAGVGVALAFLVAGVTFWQAESSRLEAEAEPFAYFEVQAIDPDGHPVAGATVRDGDRTLGVTDAFGEWRRFMRAQPGETVTITLTKDGRLAGERQLLVPDRRPGGGDVEVAARVQLRKVMTSGARGPTRPDQPHRR